MIHYAATKATEIHNQNLGIGYFAAAVGFLWITGIAFSKRFRKWNKSLPWGPGLMIIIAVLLLAGGIFTIIHP